MLAWSAPSSKFAAFDYAQTHQLVRILAVDARPSDRRSLATALSAAGYEPAGAETGRLALAEVALDPPDAVILDLDLPDLDGQEVLEQARDFYKGPIIILSARSGERDKIRALDGGADDYVVKPFHTGELLARVRAALRRRQALPAPPPIRAGSVTIDLRLRLVTRHERPIHLTPKEYDLLAKLAQAGGRVVTQRELLVSLWGPSHAADAHYLRNVIGALRAKFEAETGDGALIRTERNVGHSLALDTAA